MLSFVGFFAEMELVVSRAETEGDCGRPVLHAQQVLLVLEQFGQKVMTQAAWAGGIRKQDFKVEADLWVGAFQAGG